METFNANCLVSRRQDILSSKIDQEIILLSIDDSKYYGMDPIGSAIWHLLESPILVAHLIDTLQAQYNVTHEKCQSDVCRFLQLLLEKNLITLHHG